VPKVLNGGRSTPKIPVFTTDLYKFEWPDGEKYPDSWKFSHYRDIEEGDFNRIWGSTNPDTGEWERDPEIPIQRVTCGGLFSGTPPHKESPPLVTLVALLDDEGVEYKFHRCPICGEWFAR
jgi:hypothetical protein